MSQLIDVSNIAMPMLEIEVAIRITVNARWPNTFGREGEGAESLGALPEVLVNEIRPGLGLAQRTPSTEDCFPALTAR
jgi:hypothetical protein